MRQSGGNGIEGPLSDAPLLPSAPSQDDWILVDSPPSMAGDAVPMTPVPGSPFNGSSFGWATLSGHGRLMDLSSVIGKRTEPQKEHFHHGREKGRCIHSGWLGGCLFM